MNRSIVATTLAIAAWGMVSLIGYATLTKVQFIYRLRKDKTVLVWSKHGDVGASGARDRLLDVRHSLRLGLPAASP
jgi:hypothetical protein